MIPKTIHYCWLGGAKKTKLAKKCIKSWKKYCPDYKIVEWNESNLDISSMPLYTRQAYEQKKWGFVPDYIRCKIVHDNGGFYFDTDVQIVKSLNSLLDNNAVFGFEDIGRINLGHGFGAQKGANILREIMAQYENRSFLLEDGSIDYTPSPEINSQIFIDKGMAKNNERQIIDNCLILPTEYFCPKSYQTGITTVTSNTLSIHHFDGSWHDKQAKKRKLKRWHKQKIKWFINLFYKLFCKIFGEKNMYKFKIKLSKLFKK